MGAGTTELYLGGVQVEVAPQEAPDLADRHPGIEHQPDHDRVAHVVQTSNGEREKLFDLFLFEESYLLIQGLMHGFYRIERDLRVGRGAHPIEKASYGGVLAVDGKTLAPALEEVVAERHHLSDAHVLYLHELPLREEACELSQVRLVELRGAGRGVRIISELDAKLLDQ